MSRVWIPGWASGPNIWSSLPLGATDHTITLNHSAHDFDAYCQQCWHAAEIHEPTTVVAWSFGALVALQWLQHQPNMIKKLVLLNATPRFVSHGHWPGIDLNILLDLSQRLTHNPAKATKAFWWMLAQSEAQPKSCFAKLQQDIHNESWLSNTLSWMMSVDLRPLAQHHASRCYWLLGNRDPLIPIELQQQLPGTVRQLPGGHCPMLSHPEVLWSHIEAILC